MTRMKVPRLPSVTHQRHFVYTREDPKHNFNIRTAALSVMANGFLFMFTNGFSLIVLNFNLATG